MGTHRAPSRSTLRKVVVYGAVSLVPVLLLGVGLAANYRSEARRRGIAEGRSEANLVAQTAVEPMLDGRPLSEGVTPVENADLRQLVASGITDHHLLRLRVRDLSGRVVFSDDGSGFADRPEDEAHDAANGLVVARLTRLNSDRNDNGPAGVEAVEVYMPLSAGTPAHRVGVLELYLPYAPIAHDVASGLHVLYRDLVVGLALLWLVLFGISLSLSRGLRRQVRLNAYLAEHDTLTDLPNRALFHTRAKAALDESRRGERAVVIAIIDLDRFKEVNDTLGHNNGDLLLTELARRLAANTHPTDTVARLGGDEFGVILYGAVDGEATLWRLREVIDQQMDVNSLPLSVEASVGFVVAPEDGTDVDVLLQRADVAMYVAKSQHAGVVRYDAQQDHYDATNLALIGELRHAIEADQLVLHYQPKTSVDTGSVDAVEALVRWQHPSLGLLHPARFLPLAEQTELIDRLTTWVLNRALAELRGLGSAAADLGVAVNVSARNLSRPDFAHEVISLLERHGVAANRLIIEITETSLLLDPPRAALILAQLATAGVKVSLDDFGCGQTSFGYLSALTIHELKIDRSFVADMLVNRAHAAIVRSIIDLGHNLSLQVVGEGVETDDTLEGLRAAGCDVVQGFLVARPMPVERLRVWLAGRPLRPARSPELTG